MPDFRNEPHYRECIVSYLALLDRGSGRPINDFNADDVSARPGILHDFTRLDDDQTTADPCEPGLIVDPSPGTEAGSVAGSVIRARPIDTQGGSAPLVLELIDLLHIQLQCLANEVSVRGAVAVDFLHVGPRSEGPFFGPALSRAREMASNEVILPRIAVEEKIFRRLWFDDSLWTEDSVLRNEMDIIDCMTKADKAGLHYIDYLSAGLGYFDYDFARYAEFLGHHKHFVETGLADTSLSGDPEAYLWLKNYHDARIDDDISPPGRDAFVDKIGRAMARAMAPLRIT